MNPPVTPMNFFGGLSRSRRNHQQGFDAAIHSLRNRRTGVNRRLDIPNGAKPSPSSYVTKLGQLDLRCFSGPQSPCRVAFHSHERDL
jgi:hypothetical protein